MRVWVLALKDEAWLMSMIVTSKSLPNDCIPSKARCNLLWFIPTCHTRL